MKYYRVRIETLSGYPWRFYIATVKGLKRLKEEKDYKKIEYSQFSEYRLLKMDLKALRKNKRGYIVEPPGLD